MPRWAVSSPDNAGTDWYCQTVRVGRSLDLLKQTLPRTVRRPQPVPLVDGLPGPEALRQIAPVHPGPHPVQNPVDHLTMVTPPPTPTIAHRQERQQPFPLGIRQLTTPIPAHTQNNDPMSSQSHDRPDSS